MPLHTKYTNHIKEILRVQQCFLRNESFYHIQLSKATMSRHLKRAALQHFCS